MSRGEALADSAENPSLWRQAKVSLQRRANRAEPRRGEANRTNRTNRTNRAKRRGYKSVVRSLTAGGHRSASIQGQPLRRLAISFSLSLSLSLSLSFSPSLLPSFPSFLPLSPYPRSIFIPRSSRWFCPLRKSLLTRVTSGTASLIGFGSLSF